MERFNKEPNRCLGNREKGFKCGTRIKAQNKQAIMQLLTELTAMNIEISTPECVIDELRKLIELAICHNHCKNLQDEVNQLVLPDPPKDSARPFVGPILKEPTIKVEIEEVLNSPRISDERETSEEQGVQVVVSPVTLLTTDFSPWWDPESKSALQYVADYRPYQPPDSRGLAISTWIKRQAKEPLAHLELKTGYLYVYWNKANFGYYKIGYSCDDVSIRLKKWQTQCKHSAQQLCCTLDKVPNVKRLERLVHAELNDYRVEEKCCRGCRKSHREWFKVDLKLIKKSIRFWTDWLMKGQYEEVESKWHLREDARNELPQLCTKLSVVNAEESKAKSITISPRRYNLRPRVAKRSSSQRIRRY